MANAVNGNAPPFLASINDTGKRYAQKFVHCQPYWQSHIDNSRDLILKGAQLGLKRAKQAEKTSVTILGVSDAKDIPLLELAEQFDQIKLVDIDESSMLKLINCLPQNLSPKVSIHVLDLTNGTAIELTNAAQTIIDKARSPKEAYRKIVDLYLNTETTLDLTALTALRANYLISSVVASQLLPIPDKWINGYFHKKFGRNLRDIHSEKYLKAKTRFFQKLFHQHAQLLESLIGDGIAYWSTDVSQELSMGKLSTEEVNRLAEATEHQARAIDWQDILSEQAMNDLEKRLATQDCKNIDISLLLQTYCGGNCDPIIAGQITSALSSLLGTGTLPLQQDIELMQTMARQAEAINTRASSNFIHGRFEDYLPNGLIPMEDKASWLWILYPQQFYRGGMHRVEAYLLQGTENEYHAEI